MKVLSLFSGIGAFEKALKNLNVDVDLVGYCEIDKYASKSYSMIHGVSEDKNLLDVTKINATELPKDIDLITYGFPCQDISVAGKQKGFADENGKTRSGLFFDALRIIETAKPKIAIAENVKNLTSKKFKVEFDIVLKSLEQAGYNNYWQVLNAKDYGVPQNRERVFIVSIRKDVDNGLFVFPKKQPLEMRLKDLLENEVDEKYYLNNEKVKKFLDTFKETLTEPICAASRGRGDNNTQTLEFNKSGCTNTLTSVQKDNYVVEPKIIQVGNIIETESFGGNPQSGRIYSPEGCSPTLNTMQGGGLEPKIITNHRIRKLTPIECWRLMGFTDDDFNTVVGISNTQLYKQAGNSIVVNVLESIFKRLLFKQPIEQKGQLQLL